MSLPANVLCGEAVVLHYLCSGRGGTECVNPNNGDPGADKGPPSDRGTSFNDQDWHIRGQNLFAVIVRLCRKQVCAWHAHHSRVNAFCREPFAAFQRQVDF
jgi:hypothetical protein